MATDSNTASHIAPARQRAPDFFIVGHPKSGTTALHGMLARHPQVHMPVKEPRYFAPELRSRLRIVPSMLPDTLEGYLALFANAAPEQLVGEASPSYLRSRYAAQRIAELQPDARIVALFREPASFLRSFHLQCVHNYVETQKDLRTAIELEPMRREGKRVPLLSQSPQTLLYSDHVRYVEQLRRFHEYFPRENVLVLIYEDFRRDNEGTVRNVQRFLGIDDTRPVVTFETKPLPGVRSLPLHQLTRAAALLQIRLPNGRASLAARERSKLQGAWRKLVYTPPPPADERLMLELRRRFKPDVVALSEYLGRDLVALWGYGEID